MSHRCPQTGFFYRCSVLPLEGQEPATTDVVDTVFRSDGTTAGGTLLISRPPFTTASGQALAPGKKSVTLGPGGALSVSTGPTTRATPANTVYTVVYQVDNESVKTEFWLVGITSPTSIAAVRVTLGSAISAAPPATKQYVDAAWKRASRHRIIPLLRSSPPASS
jgi:trimeric autotransporter adhesin